MQFLIETRRAKTAFKRDGKPFASVRNATEHFNGVAVVKRDDETVRLVKFNPRTNEKVVLARA